MLNDLKTKRIGFIFAAPMLVALLLSGCAAEGPSESASPSDAVPTASENVEGESCDWESPRLASGDATLPEAQEGELAEVMLGAWQKTHSDSGDGGGFKAISDNTDVRFIFPSDSRIVACKNVDNIIRKEERAGDLKLEGATFTLPDPADGYTVENWNADSMVWVNNFDGSKYLLKRR